MKIKNLNKIILVIIPIIILFSVNMVNATTYFVSYEKNDSTSYEVMDDYGNITTTTTGPTSITIEWTLAPKKDSYKKGETVETNFASSITNLQCGNGVTSARQILNVDVSDYEIPNLNSGTYQDDKYTIGNSVAAGTYRINAQMKPSWGGINVFYITYDANGGINPPIAGQKYGDEYLKIKSSESMGKEGYIFKEWNTNSNGSGTSYSPGDLKQMKGNITLYAIWNAFTSIPTFTYAESVSDRNKYTITVDKIATTGYSYYYYESTSEEDSLSFDGDGTYIPASACDTNTCSFDIYPDQYIRVRAVNDSNGQSSSWSTPTLIKSGNVVFDTIFKFLGIKNSNAQVNFEIPAADTDLGGQGGQNAATYTETCKGWWCDIPFSKQPIWTNFVIVEDEEAPNILVK